MKYPERIINHSKGNISIMFAGTGEGELLPPYVVYKSQNLCKTWCDGGPDGTRYGRSVNGWMNTANFEEWFTMIAVPWARGKTGRKVIIGDNLSSHISTSVLQKCSQLDIYFILLPPNSTDKCQPLDVAFFGPMKKAWRAIMEKYKMTNHHFSGGSRSYFVIFLIFSSRKFTSFVLLRPFSLQNFRSTTASK